MFVSYGTWRRSSLRTSVRVLKTLHLYSGRTSIWQAVACHIDVPMHVTMGPCYWSFPNHSWGVQCQGKFKSVRMIAMNPVVYFEHKGSTDHFYQWLQKRPVQVAVPELAVHCIVKVFSWCIYIYQTTGFCHPPSFQQSESTHELQETPITEWPYMFWR